MQRFPVLFICLLVFPLITVQVYALRSDAGHCFPVHVGRSGRIVKVSKPERKGVLVLPTLTLDNRVSSLMCNTDNAGMLGSMPTNTSKDLPRPQSSLTLRVVDVAVETDTKFFNDNGADEVKVAQYAYALIDEASMIYEKELGVKLNIVYVKMWTSADPDPYQVNGNGYTLGPLALERWAADTLVERDIVVSLTSGGGGGIGYMFTAADGGGITSLCSSSGVATASPFALELNSDVSYTYSAYIVAHEIGHVFGAVHSHHCYWNPPLDSCVALEGCSTATAGGHPNPGSIMSYCAGVNANAGLAGTVRMTFLATISDYIKEGLENSFCDLTPPTPMIIITEPLSGTVDAGTPVYLSWLAHDAPNVNFYWRKKGSSPWLPVLNYKTDIGTRTAWLNMPDFTCPTAVQFKVVSADDSTVSDSTYGFIAIQPSGACRTFALDVRNGSLSASCIEPTGYGGNAASDRMNRPGSAWSFSSEKPFQPITFVDPVATHEEGTYMCWFNLSTTSGVQHFVGTSWEVSAIASMFSWNGTAGCAVWPEGSFTPLQLWGPALEANVWYHMALTYSAEFATMYVNGDSTSSIPIGKSFTSYHAPMFIGARASDVEAMSGSIDEVQIYNCVLDADSIKHIYNRESTGTSSVDDGSNASTIVKQHGTRIDVISQYNIQEVKLYNVAGYVVHTAIGRVIDTSAMSPGIYVVQVTDGHHRSTFHKVLVW